VENITIEPSSDVELFIRQWIFNLNLTRHISKVCTKAGNKLYAIARLQNHIYMERNLFY